MVPKCMRRQPSINPLIPPLYLNAISTGILLKHSSYDEPHRIKFRYRAPSYALDSCLLTNVPSLRRCLGAALTEASLRS
jgi:hypothetical protein